MIEATPSSAEIIAVFAAYLAERAESGILIAQAVSEVAYSDGVVRITFNPLTEGIDWALLMELSPFENLADFPSTVIAFKNDEGRHLRKVVKRVDAVLSDGMSLGSKTASEAFFMGTGQAWAPGD